MITGSPQKELPLMYKKSLNYVKLQHTVRSLAASGMWEDYVLQAAQVVDFHGAIMCEREIEAKSVRIILWDHVAKVQIQKLKILVFSLCHSCAVAVQSFTMSKWQTYLAIPWGLLSNLLGSREKVLTVKWHATEILSVAVWVANRQHSSDNH